MADNWEDVDRRILKARATQLAEPQEQYDQSEESPPLLEFKIMGMRYAVYLEKVEAVTRIGDIVSIPLTPPHISGVIRRRGQSIALVSLRHFFHPNTEGLADADFAVVVIASGKRFALQVEDIEGVIRLIEDRPLPPPDNFDPTQTPFLAGVTTAGLAIVDLESLVVSERFSMEHPAM